MNGTHTSDGAPLTASECFAAVYNENCDRVLAYLLRRAAYADALDAAAETWLTAWRRESELPPDPLAWLLGIARKVLANQRRGYERRRNLEHKLKCQPPSTHFEEASSPGGDLALAVLDLLTPTDREVLCLVAWEGLKPSEGAAVMGRSAPWFSVRLHRARKEFMKLHAELQLASSPALPIEKGSGN